MPKLECTIDYTNLNRIVKDMQRLSEREVISGFGEEQHSSGLSMGSLALIHEEGVRSESGSEEPWKIPPRPFMKQAGSILSESIDKESRLVVENALKGKDNLVSKYLHEIAEEGKEAIQASIDTQNFQALSPTTLRIKRAKNSLHASEILIDSGELYQSIMTEVK